MPRRRYSRTRATKWNEGRVSRRDCRKAVVVVCRKEQALERIRDLREMAVVEPRGRRTTNLSSFVLVECEEERSPSYNNENHARFHARGDRLDKFVYNSSCSPEASSSLIAQNSAQFRAISRTCQRVRLNNRTWRISHPDFISRGKKFFSRERAALKFIEQARGRELSSLRRVDLKLKGMIPKIRSVHLRGSSSNTVALVSANNRRGYNNTVEI